MFWRLLGRETVVAVTKKNYNDISSDNKRITVRCSKEDHDFLVYMAEIEQTPISNLVYHAISEFVEKNKVIL